MIIDQTDIAHLPDDQIKLMVTMLAAATEDDAGRPLVDFYRTLIVALVRANRERDRAVLVLEADAMNDDGPGALVGADDDPVANALDELRRKCRGEGLT